ncbi:MAG: aminoacyl-tRNA hydrolase [Chloroflexota bacterium]
MRFFRHREPEPDESGLWIVMGLGNPGPRFEDTRHNVGFMAANRLAARYDLRFRGSKLRAETGRGTVQGVPVLIALPETYMNESGNAATRLLSYYRVPHESLLVVCDDLDLPFGTIRLRPDGSGGGQNGLKSIIQSIGSDAFPRIRLGIGRPPGDAVSYVLSRFPREQVEMLPALLDIAADAIEMALKTGVGAAMNQYNKDWLPELQER